MFSEIQTDIEKSQLYQRALQRRMGYFLALVVFLQTAYPITENASTIMLVVYQVIYALLILVGFLVAQDSPKIVRLMLVAGIAWLITGPMWAFDRENRLLQLMGFGTISIYQALVVVVLMRFIFTAREVHMDVIIAACIVYYLLGSTFTGVYGFIDAATVETMGHHAFQDAQVDPDPEEPYPWQQLIYFSYTTLTTAGYGDVLPITMTARSVANFQSILGVLYLAIVVARLVGLYSAQEVEQAEQDAATIMARRE